MLNQILNEWQTWSCNINFLKQLLLFTDSSVRAEGRGCIFQHLTLLLPNDLTSFKEIPISFLQDTNCSPCFCLWSWSQFRKKQKKLYKISHHQVQHSSRIQQILFNNTKETQLDNSFLFIFFSACELLYCLLLYFILFYFFSVPNLIHALLNFLC